MKKVWLIGFICLSLAISGCMTANYTKPSHVGTKDKYSIDLDKDFDQTWKKLIEYSASTFFAIDNFEKDSGLITLTFGASKPSEFITGGHWKTTGNLTFDGDYVDFLSHYRNANLTGKMNIVVSKISDGKSRLTINARYIFSTIATQNNPAMTWSFDTGNCDTVIPTNPALGTSPERTICPTYKAENAIITAVK